MSKKLNEILRMSLRYKGHACEFVEDPKNVSKINEAARKYPHQSLFLLDDEGNIVKKLDEHEWLRYFFSFFKKKDS